MPVGFEPAFHRYRLPMPAQKKKPANIFVGSMADLFGEWVPDEWIREVLAACAAAPWHNFLFLTKNPDRYYQLGDGDEAIIPEGGCSGWFGASAATEEQAQDAWENLNCTWMSLEPLHGDFSEEFFTYDDRYTQATRRRWEWIVIGAETGSSKNKIKPKREWIQNIVDQCHSTETPLFMKDSLLEIWGGPTHSTIPGAAADERSHYSPLQGVRAPEDHREALRPQQGSYSHEPLLHRRKAPQAHRREIRKDKPSMVPQERRRRVNDRLHHWEPFAGGFIGVTFMALCVASSKEPPAPNPTQGRMVYIASPYKGDMKRNLRKAAKGTPQERLNREQYQ